MKSFDIKLKKGNKESKKFTIRNGGGGILSGSIGCETIKKKNWLKIPPGLCNFTITSGKRHDIKFEVDTHGLPSGFKDDGTIKITSNVGNESVEVKLSIKRGVVPLIVSSILLVMFFGGIIYGTSQNRNPEIISSSVKITTSNSAKVTCTVDLKGYYGVTNVWCEYGIIRGSYTRKSYTKEINSYDKVVDITVSNLFSDTLYYYRIVAENSAGKTYGNEMSFTTPSTQERPVVTTGQVTNVTSNSVTLDGPINPNGLPTTVWCAYRTASGSASYKSSVYDVSGSYTQTINFTIRDLSSDSKYYYKIVAKNSAGITYGEERYFTTASNEEFKDVVVRRNHHTPSSSSFSVENYLMTGITNEEFSNAYNGCATPPPKYTFFDTDKHATQWFYYQNATVGDTITWKWYKPDGYLALENEGVITGVEGCWRIDINIVGYAAYYLGQWQVKVYRNGEFLFSETFTIAP